MPHINTKRQLPRFVMSRRTAPLRARYLQRRWRRLGRVEEGRIEGRLFMADFPKFRIGSFLDTQPFRDRTDREHFAEGYRKAALPET